ncbi:efflux RND transporter periplasmic adaptor subunit [Candidatus Microgenomates bacterium]|nr:efflux RND transporter periplasmic adaptor subunit [Candidatus Microgenomates bacterium]
MTKKRLFILIGCLLLTAIAGGIYISKRRSKEEYKTTKVIKKDLIKTVSASGEVESKTEVTLKFQASGRLAWIGVKEGDKVKKWQAIASLDKRELEKTFQKYANDYLKERWDFEQTQEDYQETKERRLVTDAIQRILDEAQFDLNKAVLDYEIRDLAVKFATLFSPIDGIVTHVDASVTNVNITPATAAFIIADPDEMIFKANVDEVDIGNASEGQKAILTLDAYPEEEIEGEITQVSFSAVSTRGGGTAFPVKIRLPENKNLKFKIGMNGDIEIILEKKEDVLAVPLSAVMEKNDKHYVFLVKNGIAKKQEIKTGLETDTEIEILEGINEKDELIAEKLSKIKEGQKISD